METAWDRAEYLSIDAYKAMRKHILHNVFLKQDLFYEYTSTKSRPRSAGKKCTAYLDTKA